MDGLDGSGAESYPDAVTTAGRLGRWWQGIKSVIDNALPMSPEEREQRDLEGMTPEQITAYRDTQVELESQQRGRGVGPPFSGAG